MYNSKFTAVILICYLHASKVFTQVQPVEFYQRMYIVKGLVHVRCHNMYSAMCIWIGILGNFNLHVTHSSRTEVVDGHSAFSALTISQQPFSVKYKVY